MRPMRTLGTKKTPRMLRALGVMLVLGAAVPAMAQIENNAADLSGGYVVTRGSGLTANGWYGDVSGHVNSGLYVVGAVQGTYFSESATVLGTEIRVNASSYRFTVGPRFFLRSHRVVSPFVDVLVGGFNASVEAGVLGQFGSASVSGLGLSVGGGADFRMSDLFSVRLRPAWSHSRAEGGSANRFALRAGVVLHLGD
jgi:hypothetical protein